MDSKVIVVYIGLIFILGSCGRLNNPKERNVLSFKSSADSVLNSVEKMNCLLDSSDINNFFFYAATKGNLYVCRDNSKKVGLLSDTNLYKSADLSFLEFNKKKEFIKLVVLLKQNFLTRCDYVNGKYLYSYRANIYMADRQKDLKRYVIYTKDIRDLNLDKYKVLDNKGDLYLLADKDAIIWKN